MNTKRKKVLLPGGIDNFYKLITRRDSEGNACLFVDKSFFIKEFIDSSDDITLITRPRRFGKTLTLSMLQHFLADEVSGEKTKGLFDGLKISQHPEIMSHQGQYSVIFLTLKEVKGKNFEEAFNVLKSTIRDLYQLHYYLFSSSILLPHQKKYFQKIIEKQGDMADYKDCLLFLSQLLYQHTGKKVYILLDEYDTPINDAYLHGYYEDCRSLLSTMFNKTFKGNNALHKALITGILKVAKSSLFSELNNVEVYTMLDDSRYPQYFGFTEEETDDFLDRAGLSQKAHELKEMYNGYSLEGYTLYNPFSIVSFTKNLLLKGKARMQEALKPYWVNTGGTHLITDIVRNNVGDLQEGLSTLVQGVPLKTPINEEVIFNPNLKHNRVAFWSVLLLSGYLKVVGKEMDSRGRYTYALLFPNEEIKRTMEDLLLDVVAGGAHKKIMYLLGMQSLPDGDIETFTRFLKEYVRHVPSYFDTGERSEEPYYHGFMIGMVTSLWEDYHITSNRESGEGRYDIALHPKDQKRKGILIEIKIADEGQDLQKVAHKACKQIEDRQYAREMQAQGIKEFLYVGIAFRGKEVEVSVYGAPAKIKGNVI